MKQLLAVCVSILLTSVLVHYGACECNYQWRSDGPGNSCYIVIENPSTWAEAEEICETFGATLAQIDSEEEKNFVRSVAYNSKLQHNNIWLGGNSFISGWAWIGDRLFNYTDWCPNYPGTYTARCLAMTYDHSCTFNWSNEMCDSKFNILCEKPRKSHGPPLG